MNSHMTFNNSKIQSEYTYRSQKTSVNLLNLYIAFEEKRSIFLIEFAYRSYMILIEISKGFNK